MSTWHSTSCPTLANVASSLVPGTPREDRPHARPPVVDCGLYVCDGVAECHAADNGKPEDKRVRHISMFNLRVCRRQGGCG